MVKRQITLEDRVRKLEAFRYRLIGRVNVLQTMLLDCWMQTIEKAPDPVALAEAMRKRWLENIDKQLPQSTGANPADLEVVSQDQRKAMEDLTADLVRRARLAKANRQRKG